MPEADITHIFNPITVTLSSAVSDAVAVLERLTPRSGSWVYDILMLVCVFLVLIFLRRFVEIYPTAVNCLFKWKEAARLEFNLKLRHTRNIVYAVLILPICLLLDRFFLFPPPFMEDISPDLHILCTIGIFLVYGLLRWIMKGIFTGRKADKLVHNGEFNLFRTLFCVVPPFFLATAGLMSVFGVAQPLIETIVFAEILLSYLILFWRQREILVHYRSGLATILYLCGVEILPICFVAVLWYV